MALNLSKALVKDYESSEPDREVPCSDCGALTTITGFAWEFARAMNHILYKRGESILKKAELVIRCESCVDKHRRAIGGRLSQSYWRSLGERAEEVEKERRRQLSMLDEEI